MSKIFLLTGHVHSGKTSRLAEWVASNKSIDGILAPILNQRRYLMDIHTSEKRLLEVDKDHNSSSAITVGKYFFSCEVFEWGCKKLMEAHNKAPNWIVIDEFGPLELRGNGLSNAIEYIMSNRNSLTKTKLLFVVRNKLVNAFRHHFNLPLQEATKFEYDT